MPDYTPTPAQQEVIAEISRLLDDLPLAVELIAAHASEMTVQDAHRGRAAPFLGGAQPPGRDLSLFRHLPIMRQAVSLRAQLCGSLPPSA